MSVYRTSTTDVARKAAIVELLTSADSEVGAYPLANGPKLTGALSAADIRSALGCVHSEAMRLINELVDDSSIVRVADPNSDPSTWRYTVA